MAYAIGDACVACGACEAQCPVGAISMGDGKFEINADMCIDCGSCVYFRQPAESILGVCHNENMRCVSAKQMNTGANKEETL